MRIRVVADYRDHPLKWDADAGQDGNIDPASLGLSPRLIEDLAAWAAHHDAVMLSDEHGNSGFSREGLEAFHRRGALLAERVAAELGPTATVRYG